VVIDDFLSALAAQRLVHPRQARWISEFERGWHAASLITTAQAVTLARRAGFQLVAARDWTPYLRTLDRRNSLVRVVVAAGAVLPLRLLLGQAYWDSLVGGNALQLGTRHGIFQYHSLVLEIPPTRAGGAAGTIGA
jgi:hypothetical protein